ncbi:MAG: hypothetical protein HQL26_07840 [Candidatus Omnitrophica bacterium]|nr:hypothetical protein [Candidatus Omnitrophota bacterium]
MEKKYNLIFITIVTLAISFVISMNVLWDIYRIFGISHFNNTNVSANFRYLKVKFLNAHPDDYDAFIVGSSRTNFYAAKLASQLSGLHYYSFSAAAEKLDLILNELVWLKKRNIKIKQVILGLDYDFMFLVDDFPKNAIEAKEHPLVSGESWFSFYPPFALNFDFNNWRKAFRDVILRHKPASYQFDQTTGHWYYVDRDQAIVKDHAKYFKERFKMEIPYVRGKLDRVAVNLERLKRLMNFIDQEKIPRIVIINPYSQYAFKSFTKEEYSYWLKSVVNICGQVWDFSGLNAITTNDWLYYDTSHFLPKVGDMILKKVFSVPDPAAPKDFGVLLNADRQ